MKHLYLHKSIGNKLFNKWYNYMFTNSDKDPHEFYSFTRLLDKELIQEAKKYKLKLCCNNLRTIYPNNYISILSKQTIKHILQKTI